MAEVEENAIIELNDKCKKKKSDKLGVEVLKRNAEGGTPPKKRAVRSHSTAPHFPSSSVAPKPKREKPHHSDDDEEEGDDNNIGEDGGAEEETSTMGTSSSSVTLSIDEDDDEDNEDEKEGRCYTFDAASSSCELSFADEEDGDADEEEHTVDDDEEDDDESESYDTTTEGTETAYDVEDNDDEGDEGDLPQTERVAKASSFESINAVTGVVGRPRGLTKLKLPLRDSSDGSDPISSPRSFSNSPRGYYSPRPMMAPMTPHKAALGTATRERVCDVEYVVEDGQRMVAAGTLQGLVDRLISIDEGVVDFDLHYFTSVFLITHPMYVPTTELLRRIFDVYEEPATPFPGGADDPRVLQQRVKTRVLEVLKKWVEEFFNDFKAGCEAREVLDTWITQQAKELTGGEDGEEALDQQNQLLKKIQALLSSNDLIQKHMVPIAPAPPPAAMAHYNDPDKMSIPLPPPPPVDDLSRFCVLDFPPAKIAQQLTYIDFQMFSAVRFNEFYHCAWSKKNCEQNAPNLVRLIERFNKVSQWIQTSIVRVRDLKKRTAVLARFIHIAQEFEWLHNFQGMMMVNAALNNSAISRLKHTWAALGDEDRERFDSIQNFFSPYHNYASYRQKLRTSVPPIVPFMALFLTDLTFIDENEDKVARKKAEAEGGANEHDAKEAHDERSLKAEEDANANANASGDSDATKDFEATPEEIKDLVNFQKMELVGKVLLNVRKFQKATYKNLIPSGPFQKLFGEIAEVAMPSPEEAAREKKKEDLYSDSCFMWSLDHIYKYSLIIEPRDGKPPKAKTAKSKKSHRTSATAPASLESSPVKPKKESRKGSSAASKKYATMGRSSKRAPDATLTIQQNPLLMQLQSRNLQKRTSRSGSIDAPSATNPPPATPGQPPVTINPLIAAAAAAAKKEKERSYSMPPIILEKSASLSALRKYREEKEEELERSRDESNGNGTSTSNSGSDSSSKSNSFDNTTIEGDAREALSPSSLSTSMMAVSERRKSDNAKKERKEKKEKKKEKGSKLHKKEKKSSTLLATTDY